MRPPLRPRVGALAVGAVLLAVAVGGAGCASPGEAFREDSWVVRWESRHAQPYRHSVEGDVLELGGGYPDWSVFATRRIAVDQGPVRLTVEGSAGLVQLQDRCGTSPVVVAAAPRVVPGAPVILDPPLGPGRHDICIEVRPSPTAVLDVRVSMEVLG